MPKIVSTARALAYLRALGQSGNASLAAAQAGVSRDWAYKKRLADARFDALCRAMLAAAKARGCRCRCGGIVPEGGRRRWRRGSLRRWR